MSYRKKHIKKKINKIKPKKSIFKKLWFWIIILSIIIVLSVFYFAFFYSGFQVKNINISGNSRIKTEDLRNLVSENSNTNLVDFFGIKITSRSILLINNKKISNNILEKFPEIEKISANRNFPHDLTINVVERNPIGVFCPQADSNSNNCYLIDANGVIFEPFLIAPANILIVRQKTNNEQILGKKSVPQNIIDSILRIKKLLEDNFKINLKEAFIADSLKLNITTGENWQIYFDLGTDSNINAQITKLNLLLQGEITQDSRKNLRYINLIPEDRAVVCDNKICGG